MNRFLHCCGRPPSFFLTLSVLLLLLLLLLLPPPCRSEGGCNSNSSSDYQCVDHGCHSTEDGVGATATVAVAGEGCLGMAEEDCQNVSSTNFKISHASVTGGSAQTTVVYATSTASVPTPDPSIVGYPVSRYAVDRRQLDPVGTVRPEHLQSNPLGVSDEEWKTRTELAAAYRALYLLGLEGPATLGSDQAAQCLMHRNTSPRALDDNQNVTSFFMADWGVWFEEVTASNLLHFTVDGDEVLLDGTTRPGRPDRMNSGCVPVARAIFQARPDVRTIIHIHPHAVMAVGGLEWGLLPLSQAAFFLWGQVSREDYDFTYEQSFEETLQHGFDNGQRAMLLNHHGMYAVGRDVAEAVFVATHLTQACEVQVRTLSMVGGDLSKVLLPSSHDLSTQYKDMMDSTDYSYDGSREWPGIVRKVQRQAPDFNL